MPFILGNMGIIILGFLLDISRLFRAYSLFSGLIALLALVFFETHLYFGIGIGGMERITAYPQTTWLIVFGIYMSKNHIVKNYRKYRLSAK
jgi:hypothetical membrane protein